MNLILKMEMNPIPIKLWAKDPFPHIFNIALIFQNRPNFVLKLKFQGGRLENSFSSCPWFIYCIIVIATRTVPSSWLIQADVTRWSSTNAALHCNAECCELSGRRTWLQIGELVWACVVLHLPRSYSFRSFASVCVFHMMQQYNC